MLRVKAFGSLLLSLIVLVLLQGRLVGLGVLQKITAEVRDIVKEQMRRDDGTTASQLHALPLLVGRGYSIYHCLLSLFISLSLSSLVVGCL